MGSTKNLQQNNIRLGVNNNSLSSILDTINNLPKDTSNEENTRGKSKGVDFIDIDGTILYSYTVEEAQTLTELPEPPIHEGLICQGWNWTLEDIKEFRRDVVVGAMYITDDEKTRLYINISTELVSDVTINFRQSVEVGVEVDWGDGTAPLKYAGKNTTITITHKYNKKGDYVITFNPLEDCKLTLGGNYRDTCLMSNKQKYKNMLTKVELGKNVIVSNYTFDNNWYLISVTTPNTLTNIGEYAFQYCYSLKYITLPNSMTAIKQYAFYCCYSLKNISIPNCITSIADRAFQDCCSLENITLPNTITVIKQYGLSYCYALKSITLPNNITELGSNVFSYSLCYDNTELIIPETLASIPTYAFSSFKSGKSIIFKGVKTINGYAFYQCLSCQIITMSKELTYIGARAFYQNLSMAMYDFSATEQVPTLGATNAFTSIPSDCKIVVPDNLYDEWIVATNWSTYTDNIVKVSEFTEEG